MEKIRQNLTEFRIPNYMEEILTENHCSAFLRMSIIRENESYKFNYRPGNLQRLAVSNLNTYEKMLLLRKLIELIERTKRFLVPAENYLIEPELIYSVDGCIYEGIRLMFYPDVKRMKPEYKILQFAERIVNKKDREERDVFNQLLQASENGNMNRMKLFLDKYIVRAENRMINKAG